MKRRAFLENLLCGATISAVKPSFAINIITALQTLIPGQSMEYKYKGIIYRLYLDQKGLFHIGKNIKTKNEVWKQLEKIKIDFDRKVDLLYATLGKEKQNTIKKAKQGIDIKDILQITVTEHNLEISIGYESKEYFCSIPLQYFHQIVENQTSSSVTLPHNAIEEIYGETQETLDEASKKLYQEVHGHLKGLIITLK